MTPSILWYKSKREKEKRKRKPHLGTYHNPIIENQRENFQSM